MSETERYRTARSGIALVALMLGGGCTEPTPLYCDEDHACDPGYWCDLPNKTCVKNQTPDGAPDASPDAPLDAPPPDRGCDAADAARDMAKPNGSGCTAASECTSGYCVDGVCCDSLCTLTCHTCAAPGSPGTCSPVDPGSDPDKECQGADPACAGTCDGKGSCAFPAASKSCGAKTCTAGKVTEHRCDGQGGCSAETTDCGGYSCDPATNDCRKTCNSTSDCTGSFQCVNKACVGALSNGSVCGQNDQACKSKHCVDGVCCDSDCTGVCRACDLPSSPGTCANVPAQTAAPADCPGDTACGPGECNGKGACAYPKAGQLCGNGTVCTAGAQTDHRCSPTHICQAGTPDPCTPYICDAQNKACLASCTTSAQCIAAAYCTGNKCLAKKTLGQSCTAAGQCSSGYCEDSVCCSSSCANVCWSCDVAGSKGTCTADPAKNGTSCGTNAVCQQGSCVCQHTPCGATCCAAGQVCKSNACCTPSCSGRECGPDPVCGVSCGTCSSNASCQSGTCVCQHARCGSTCCASGEVCHIVAGTCGAPTGGWAVATQGAESAWKVAVAVDNAKNVFLAGSITAATTFGTKSLTPSGKADIFIAKLSPSGAFQWAVRVVGSANEYNSIQNIATDGSGNIYVLGNYGGQATFGAVTLDSNTMSSSFVAKLSPAGSFLWATSPVNSGGFVMLRDITVDSAGNPHVVGEFMGTPTFGTISLTPKATVDFLVAKLSTGGDWISASSFSAGATASGNGLAVDGSGNRFVCGYFEGSSTASPLASKGSHDVFVAKVSTSGGLTWITQAGGTQSDMCYLVDVNSVGDPIVLGGFEGTASFGTISLTSTGANYVARLDGSSGTFSWVTSPKDVNCQDMVLDSSDNVYVVGGFTGAAVLGSTNVTSMGLGDVFVAKLSPAGAFLSAISAGGTSTEDGRTIALDSAGELVVGGLLGGPVSLGTATLQPKNTYDYYIWKLPN